MENDDSPINALQQELEQMTINIDNNSSIVNTTSQTQSKSHINADNNEIIEEEELNHSEVKNIIIFANANIKINEPTIKVEKDEYLEKKGNNYFSNEENDEEGGNKEEKNEDNEGGKS